MFSLITAVYFALGERYRISVGKGLRAGGRTCMIFFINTWPRRSLCMLSFHLQIGEVR